MKQYAEPELEIIKFEITDDTNFGSDNELSAPKTRAVSSREEQPIFVFHSAI